MNIDKDIENLQRKIEHNAGKIENNAQRIQQNTGALEILKAFKSDSNKFFIMWIVTFVALLCSLGYIVYMLNDTMVIETTEQVSQENSGGDNNYIGNDGEISYGETSD